MSRKFVLTEKQREGVSNRITEIIMETGYETFKEFATQWEVSPQTLQNWRKDGNINSAFLLRFANKFNVTLDWLLEGPPHPKRRKPSPE